MTMRLSRFGQLHLGVTILSSLCFPEEAVTIARRVVFLTHTLPLPLVSGERIRDFNLIEQLARRDWDVSLFSLVPALPVDAADMRRLQAICDDIFLYDFRQRFPARHAKLAKSVLLRRAYYASFATTPAAIAAFRRWLAERQPDVVMVGQLFMQPYVPEPYLPIAVLDCHNAEVNRMRTMSSVLGLRPKGIVARLQIEPVRRFELEAARRAARVLTVSAPEQTYFQRAAAGRVALIPNGVDCDRHVFRTWLPPGPRILHMGSLDYTPNVDGFNYLVQDILPHVRHEGATLTVIGSNPRPSIAETVRRAPVPTELAGQVEATLPYLEQARVLVVPLRFGGGTRLKILEALAHGVPVVTTSVGCEGLDVEHERHVLIADDPHDFALAIERLFRDDDLCMNLAISGRQLVESRYDWKAIGQRLDETLLELLQARPQGAPALARSG